MKSTDGMSLRKRHRNVMLIVILGVGALGGPGVLRADAFGNSYDHLAQVSLQGGGGAHVQWNNDPTQWYVNAQGFVFHSDSGAAFAQDKEEFEPCPTADGLASMPMLSVANTARAVGLLSDLADDGGACSLTGQSPVMSISEAYSFAHRIPASAASADALTEFQTLFRLVADDPQNPPDLGELMIGLIGEAHLMGDSLPDEDWSANYAYHFEIGDAEDGSVLFNFDMASAIGGPGFDSLDDAWNISGESLELALDHDYYVYSFFDGESSAFAPEPASAALLLAGSLFLSRRRRRGPGMRHRSA